MLRDAIAVRNTRFAEALRQSDADALETVYEENVTMSPDSGPTLAGRASVAAWWRRGMGSGLRSASLAITTLHRAADLAIELGRYTLTVGADELAVYEEGKRVAVHRRQTDGSWRTVCEVFEPD